MTKGYASCLIEQSTQYQLSWLTFKSNQTAFISTLTQIMSFIFWC